MKTKEEIGRLSKLLKDEKSITRSIERASAKKNEKNYEQKLNLEKKIVELREENMRLSKRLLIIELKEDF